MKSAKVIITGPAKAGTTTFIRSLSEIAVLTTERRLDGAREADGSEATVALDFGRITVAPDLVLYLFGTPGEEPESLGSGPLGDGTLGVIVVVDAMRPASIDDAVAIVDFLKSAAEVPFAIAANRLGPLDDKRLDVVRSSLRVPPHVPVVACQALERESAKRVLLALLDGILDERELFDADGAWKGRQ
jgi:signal recognition particle receptor subunit beta